MDPPSLDATVRLTGTQLVVVNGSEDVWRNCEVEINPGTLSSGYSQEVALIAAGDSVAGGLLAFTRSGGERFNPSTHAVEEVVVQCDTPAGTGYYFGSW